MPAAEERASLLHKRGLVKRRITNLVKKIDQLLDKSEERPTIDFVCGEQYIDELRELDRKFQDFHEAASELVIPDDNESIEKDNEEIDNHDDRVRDRISKLLFLLSQRTPLSKPTSSSASSSSKVQQILERKWKRLDTELNDLVNKITGACQDPDTQDIEELCELKVQLPELVKTLNILVNESDSASFCHEDSDLDKLDELSAHMRDKIKSSQGELASLINNRRRAEKQRQQQQELEDRQRYKVELEHRERELELQAHHHREDMAALRKTLEQSTEQRQKTVKLPELDIPTFDGEPTNWNPYWQQFEATIHNSKRLDDQLRIQYLLKSLTTKKARDAVEGIDAVGEAYSEAVAALKSRFDRPQVIHRAHVRALLTAPVVKDGSSSELRQLHDTFQHHLRSLRALDKLNFEQFITALGETKLDSTTMVEWQKYIQTKTDVPKFEEFLEFLDLRSTATELDSYSSKKFHNLSPNKTDRKLGSKFSSSSTPKPVSTYATSVSKCLACSSGKHSLAYCQTYKRKPVSDRRNFAQAQGLCFNCLRGSHTAKHCPSPHRCRKCDKTHHTLLHLDSESHKPISMPMMQTASTVQVSNSVDTADTSTSTANPVVTLASQETVTPGTALMMTANVIVSGPHGSQMVTRALLDPASTASFVSERVAQYLKLPRHKQSICINGIGGTQCPSPQSNIVDINLKSLHDPSSLTQVQAIVLPKLTKRLPVASVPAADWPHLKSLQLADPEFNISKPIEILLGVNEYQDVLKPGMIQGPKGSPAAQATIFGWVLFGSAGTAQISHQATTLHVSTNLPSCEEILQKFWTLEEGPSVKPPLSATERTVVRDFEQRHQRDTDGRFIVPLPFNPTVPSLGASRPQALRRFLSLERRLHKSAQVDDYANVINEYITSGHAERVPSPDLNKAQSKSFYLPHHAIFKDSTTTALRVVFDGSMKSSTGISLNDRLLVGPTVHPPLNDVLMRFRKHPYALTTDVAKMYRAVCLAPEDKDYHRFLWRNKPTDPVVDYRMNRTTFGIASAAFAATNSVKHLTLENKSEFPLAARAVEESFYVDDGLPSVETKEEAIVLRQQLQDLFHKGGFNLRKWHSNSSEVLNTIPPELQSTKASLSLSDSDTFVKSLGVEYNPHHDQFRFNVADISTIGTDFTKRTVLSDSAKIFDPLGMVACVTIVVKIIFQRLWERGIDWDDPLPPDILQDWTSWREQLAQISTLRVPRCYTPPDRKIVNRELIGFSDASERAYCGVVYLRSTDTAGGIHVTLVTAKTRVAPIKKATLPRLELCGAHLLAQLMRHVQRVLDIPPDKVHAFTDSTIVLYWIFGSTRRFKTFEANRIAEIQECVPPQRWKHISGEENPADCGSRGILPEEILNHHLWWSGPQWLVDNPSEWSTKLTAPPSLETLSSLGIPRETVGLKQTNEITLQVTTSATASSPAIDIARFSSFTRLKRVTALVFRVITKSHLFSAIPLSAQELTKAETWWFEQVQAEMFAEVVTALKHGNAIPRSNRLLSLNPFLDSDGLLRVGGRLSKSLEDYQFRHPLILAGDHQIVTLIVQHEHQRLHHAGPKLVLSSLQERYQIMGGRRVVRKWIRQCVVCRRASPKVSSQLMGQLPAERVRPTFANDRVSVDYAGPLTLKLGSTRRPTYHKAYVAVFVCLETKASHIELVSDLTSEAFQATLRRFIARRGKPRQMWSDNATCFRRADKDLNELFRFLRQQATQDSVINFCSSQGIQWKFSPPSGPHHGSVWENGVKSCKRHLKRIVGQSKLTFEEMATVLSQIEACLNSRPVTATVDANDDDSITPLTPGHFLIGRPLEALPDHPDTPTKPTHLLKRWQLCQTLVHHFWNRWSKEYLSGLQRFNKWRFPKRNLELDDVVLIKDDRAPPCHWPLARIVKTHPGPDQLVRVVTVKTADGTYLRPIVKLCLLVPKREQV